MKFADHVIAANPIWQEKITLRNRLSESKVSCFLNHPTLTNFQYQAERLNGRDIVLIYPGSISPHHAVDVAIRAVSLLRKKLPKIRFFIYGRPSSQSYFAELTSLIRDLDLMDTVKFMGSASSEELKEVYSTVDVGIIPKNDGIFSSEAFSTKVFDYMASGIPVIMSKTKIDEIYFDDSLVKFFTPGSPYYLARAILEVHDNRESARAMAQRARDFAVRNSWDLIKTQYVSLVERMA